MQNLNTVNFRFSDILRGDLLYVFPCVILFLCFSVLLVLLLPRLGKRELILVLFVRLFDLCLFGFVGFLFLLGSGRGCGLWLWHSLGFSLTFLVTTPILGPLRYQDTSSVAQGWPITFHLAWVPWPQLHLPGWMKCKVMDHTWATEDVKTSLWQKQIISYTVMVIFPPSNTD